MQFARTHRVPLWLGEYGGGWSGPATERPDRLCALDDLLAICNAEGVHWTIWSYKDLGAMGWVHVASEAPYVRQIAPITAAKARLRTDLGTQAGLPPSPVSTHITALAEEISTTLPAGWVNGAHIMSSAFGNYVGTLLQGWYAQQFVGLDEEALTTLTQSFAFEHCQVQTDILGILQHHFRAT